MIVLFVCHANLNRSPRAAEVFQKLAYEKGLDVEIQSAGTDAPAGVPDPEFVRAKYGVERTTQLTNEMLNKADIVVALDPWVEKEIRAWYESPEKIIVLSVPDRFSLRRGNLDALYEILNQQLEPLTEELSHSQGRTSSKEAM